MVRKKKIKKISKLKKRNKVQQKISTRKINTQHTFKTSDEKISTKNKKSQILNPSAYRDIT